MERAHRTPRAGGTYLAATRFAGADSSTTGTSVEITPLSLRIKPAAARLSSNALLTKSGLPDFSKVTLNLPRAWDTTTRAAMVNLSLGKC